MKTTLVPSCLASTAWRADSVACARFVVTVTAFIEHCCIVTWRSCWPECSPAARRSGKRDAENSRGKLACSQVGSEVDTLPRLAASLLLSACLSPLLLWLSACPFAQLTSCRCFRFLALIEISKDQLMEAG